MPTMINRELARFDMAGEEVVAYRYSRRLGQVYDKWYALDCKTDVSSDHQIPRLAMVSASDDRNLHYVIHPDDVAAFVLAHRGQSIVFHGAAATFWAIYDHLIREGQHEAAAAWMDLLRHRRLHDTQLLDMLLRLAVRAMGTDLEPRDLVVLAAEYAELEFDQDNPLRTRFDELIGTDWSRVDPGFFECALSDVIAIARAYPPMRREAIRLMTDAGFTTTVEETFTIDPEAIKKYGVLTEGVQVGAAIALAKIGRTGMHIRRDRVQPLKKELESKIAKVFTPLNDQFPGLFKLDAHGQPLLTETGMACKSDKCLVEFLEAALADIREETDEPIETPKGKKGGISRSADAWAHLADKHPFLRLWSRYEAATNLYQFVRQLDADIVYPEYAVLKVTGRTSCSSPNVQGIPREDRFRELFKASPGHLLLVVDFCFIELVALAAICLCRFGFSKLADVIRGGNDPHCNTAAMLLKMAYEIFLKLKTKRFAEYKRWREMAKPVNYGVPVGMGADKLVDYARTAFSVEMSRDEAEQFHHRLVTEIYPELQLYLADTSLDSLAKNLHVTAQAVCTAFYVADNDAHIVSRSIQKIVAGRPLKYDGTSYDEGYVQRVWDVLNELNQNVELRRVISARVGSPQLADRLFFASVPTLTGRVRAGVTYTSERNTQFQGLAADGAKVALTNLIAEGYRVVGFVHDEILVELPDEGGYVGREAVEKVVKIIVDGMREVAFGVPVTCEYTVTTHWSKSAKLIGQGDKITAWSPKEKKR